MTVALSGPVVKPLLAGIKQAMAYAVENGVALAAVTDGNTWLFFKASRIDGTPPLQGKGILFPTLDSVVKEFGKFAELLGWEAVRHRRPLAHLNEAEGLAVAEAEQQFHVLDPADARMRATRWRVTLLCFSPSSSLGFQTIRIERCCATASWKTSESRKADLELEKIIQRVVNNISALNTDRGGALQQELERTMTSRRSETVLLIGNKGAGKSTFIDRFFHQMLPLSLREKCVVVRVDLGDYHGDPQGIVPWTILRLRDFLEKGVCRSDPPTYDELQGIFFSEYQRWSVGERKHLYETNKTEFKNQFGLHMEKRREVLPDEYVRMLLDWASRGHQRLPCLIYDNTDQFPPEVQDSVYQLAHSYEGAAPCFNVVPITDRTVLSPCARSERDYLAPR